MLKRGESAICRKKCSVSQYIYFEQCTFLWHLSVNGASILSWIYPTSAIIWIDVCHPYMAIETQKIKVYSEYHSLFLFHIRNAVNTRLFGAYNPKKIKIDLSHYVKGRPGAILGGFFAWIDRKEAKK